MTDLAFAGNAGGFGASGFSETGSTAGPEIAGARSAARPSRSSSESSAHAAIPPATCVIQWRREILPSDCGEPKGPGQLQFIPHLSFGSLCHPERQRRIWLIY